MRVGLHGRLAVTLCLLFILSVTQPTTSGQEDSSVAFLYVSQEHRGAEVILHRVDPQTGTEERTGFDFGIDYSLFQAHLSSTRTWVVFVPVFNPMSPTPSTIKLYNLQTQAMSDLDLSVALTTGLFYNLGHAPQIVWSPDDSYLAIITEGGRTLHLFDGQTQTATPILQGAHYMSSLWWSRDGSRLAYAKDTCTGGMGCQLFMEVYNVSQRQIETTIPLEGASNGVSFSICNVQLSPDNRYISFTRSCESDNLTATMEVYVADTVTGEINQVTNFTLGPDVPPPAIPPTRRAVYATLWLDDHSLLIGAVYRWVPSLDESQATLENITLHYDAETLELTPFWEVGIGAFTPSPDRALIAVNNSVFPGVVGEVEILSIQDTPRQPVVIASLPIGSSFYWSENADWLAYTYRGDEPFFPHLEWVLGFYFLNLADGQPELYLVPTPPDTLISPVGWVEG